MNGSFTLEQYERRVRSTERQIRQGKDLFSTYPGLHEVCDRHEECTDELCIINKRTPLYLFFDTGDGSYRLALCLFRGRGDDEKHVKSQPRHFMEIVTKLLEASVKPRGKKCPLQSAKPRRNGRHRKETIPHRRSKGRTSLFR